MTTQEVKQLFLDEKLVAICRTLPTEKLGNVAKALVKGGVKILEITIDQMAQDPAAVLKEAMQTVRDAVGDQLCLGCGTVLNCEQLQMAYDAGAVFYLSPNFKADVVKKAKEMGLVAIPGALTPTEIVDAWEAGADIVKLFPANEVGLSYIKAIKAPLRHIPLMATGGVRPSNAADYIKAGSAAIGVGGNLVNKEWVAAGEFDKIKEMTAEAVALVKEIRG